MSRQELIKKISEILKTVPSAESWLFGSSARGDYREDSDIHLLILLPDSLTSKERICTQEDILEMLLPIEIETGIEITPVILQHKVWNQRKTPFTINVNRERISL